MDGMTLLQGDVLEKMAGLERESVDLIFSDPPFNVKKRYGGKQPKDDARDDYYEWCAAWIEAGFDLLKPTGSFYLMTIPRHIFRMGTEMAKHSRGMGMKRGYRRERIRLICHGPGHSDTICVVDRKVREQLTLFDFSDEQESEE